MRHFQNTSLRRKQTLIIMLTSAVSLLLACAAFIAHDVFKFRQEMVESVSSLAEVVSLNTASAIDFNDSADAARTLAALRGEPNIALARVHTKDGGEFATYAREGTPPPEIPYSLVARHEFTAKHLYLFRPILQKGEQVGMIELVVNLDELQQRLWRYAGIAGLVLAVSLLAAFGLSTRLQKLVSDPILHLAQVARLVALDKNYSVRATKQGDDELGQLVDGFNEMLAQIQARDIALETARDDREKRAAEQTQEREVIHQQRVEASRLGGMAEVATSVLHNVGNVLNSVNIASSCVADSLRNSKAANLSKVVALLREHEKDLGDFFTNSPKGKQVPVYLAQLAEHLAGEQAGALKELAQLQKNIEHIKDIVTMQQGFAKASGVTEIVNVTELVEDALRMNLSGLAQHDIQVIREFKDTPLVTVEKHKVLQILVNLVRNAKHACEALELHKRKLTLRTTNGEDRVRIAVSDNGVGIPRENLDRIFSHGFTTKKDGHGFGLHSGALAAREMGGALNAHSDGTGLGATFTLELPLNRNEPVNHIDENQITTACLAT